MYVLGTGGWLHFAHCVRAHVSPVVCGRCVRHGQSENKSAWELSSGRRIWFGQLSAPSSPTTPRMPSMHWYLAMGRQGLFTLVRRRRQYGRGIGTERAACDTLSLGTHWDRSNGICAAWERHRHRMLLLSSSLSRCRARGTRMGTLGSDGLLRMSGSGYTASAPRCTTGVTTGSMQRGADVGGARLTSAWRDPERRHGRQLDRGWGAEAEGVRCAGGGL